MDSVAKNLKHVLHIYIYVCVHKWICVYSRIYIFTMHVYKYIWEYYCAEYISGWTQYCWQLNLCPLKLMGNYFKIIFFVSSLLLKGTDHWQSVWLHVSAGNQLHAEKEKLSVVKRRCQNRTCNDGFLKSSHDTLA